MDTTQLRLCMFATLRDLDASDTRQYLGLVSGVSRHAASLGFMSARGRGEATLDPPDAEKVRQLFWSLIAQGVIVPGLDQSNFDVPFFTLTDFGRRVVNSPDPVPHDPDGYLSHLASVAPNVDEIARSYIAEGLECFRRGVYRASLVMLGVAAEKLVLDLAAVVAEKLPPNESNKLSGIAEQRRIAVIFDETIKHLQTRLDRLPGALSDRLPEHLGGIFTIIRVHRNEAGHPTATEVDQLTAFCLFSSFPLFCRRWSQLIKHLKEHGFDEGS